MFGERVRWQGVVAANLGECSRAVGYFAIAHREGTTYDAFYEQLLLSPIADCDEFEDFMKPKSWDRSGQRVSLAIQQLLRP